MNSPFASFGMGFQRNIYSMVIGAVYEPAMRNCEESPQRHESMAGIKFLLHAH